MKKQKISVSLPALLMFVSPMLFGKAHITLAVITSAVLHEMGHILASEALGVELKELSLDLLGAKLHTSGHIMSYKSEIILCLSGPAVNFICAALIFPFIMKGYLTSEFAECFFVSSVILGSVNMLPISTFDGGRTLSCLLYAFLPARISHFISNAISVFCLCCLWCISVYMLLRFASTLTLFVFSVSLFVRTAIFEE